MNKIDFEKSNGLVPVIVQDDTTLKVLMLGYMNEEAYEKTLAEKRVTFYSRSKNRLWTKGEESGNFLDVVSIEVDCDNDTLLIRANPYGPVCHTGTLSCFNDNKTEGFIRELYKVVVERHKNMPEGSYTTHLYNKGVAKIAQKVGEEAVETVIEAMADNKERFIYESSDLIYHLLVLVEQMGCTLEDLEKELFTRHK